MKIDSAFYSHTLVGFPKVILKFSSSDGLHYEKPYVTIKGIINPWSWSFNQDQVAPGGIQSELDIFDNMVRSRFKDDITVQG